MTEAADVGACAGDVCALLLVRDDDVPSDTRFAFAIGKIGDCTLDCIGVCGTDEGTDRSGLEWLVNTLEPGTCVREAVLVLVSIAVSVDWLIVSIQTAAA